MLPIWFDITVGAATLAGLVLSCLTLWQAASAKNAAESTREAVSRTLSVASLARFGMMVHETREYLRHNKLEIANLRLREIKGAVIELQQMPWFNENSRAKELGNHRVNIDIDIRAIERDIKTSRSDADLGKVIDNLEDLADFLSQNEAQIKFNSHD